MKTQWTIATFNLWGFNPERLEIPGETRYISGLTSDRVVGLDALLQGEDVDVIGLQETSTWRTVIQERLMDRYAFAPAPSYFVGGADCDIIYRRDRFTQLDCGFFYLHPEGLEERGWDAKFIRRCAWALLQKKETGAVALFATTHLEHDGPHARAEGSKLLGPKLHGIAKQAEKRYGLEECPILLVGDMNDKVGSEVYQALTSCFLDARKESLGPTVSDRFSSFSGIYHADSEADIRADGLYIDHIFLRGNAKVLSVKRILTATNLCPYGSYISDHNAIIARVIPCNQPERKEGGDL